MHMYLPESEKPTTTLAVPKIRLSPEIVTPPFWRAHRHYHQMITRIADEKENNSGETLNEDQDLTNHSLNLSQLESKNKRPRVHWAHSPLTQSHVPPDQGDDTPDQLNRPEILYSFVSAVDDPSNVPHTFICFLSI